ncbi:MAG TPA: hypothetical protein VFB71_06885 [Ramlibacter sp.]|nr:hypothetical protein [Ramlibacter sp.]
MNPHVHAAVFAAGALLADAGLAQDAGGWRNVTTGGPLRPGIYGRIVPRADASPPPVIYPQPVIASDALVPPAVRPVYLYVPPGQVRKWKQNCSQWAACDQPVLFVRVDQSPSRWGKWRQLRAPQWAQQEPH